MGDTEVAGKALGRRVEALRHGGLRVEGHIEQGNVDEALTQMVRETKPALLVLGNHGRRGIRRLLGSLAERMVRHAGCPVLVVPETP
jgi:nucleotide-binding universal stress UspA family protein